MKDAKTIYILRILLRKALPALYLVPSVFCLLHGVLPAYAEQKTFTIAIVQPLNIKAYHEAVEGFLETLGRRLPHDFNTMMYESPQGLFTRLQKKTEVPIDLILTVGNEATSEVSRNISDIPIVFTMVLNPENVITNHENAVGASVNIPIDVQLKMIKEILPAMEDVGIIYDPTWNAGFIEQSINAAKALNLDLLPVPVTSQKDIPNALKQVRNDADVLLAIVDNTVYTSGTARNIIEYTHKNDLPFVGISEPWVKAGALWALYFDNKDIGRQAAELASRILSGNSAATLRIATPEKVHLALNLRTAELIGVEISKKITDNAVRDGIVYE